MIVSLYHWEIKTNVYMYVLCMYALTEFIATGMLGLSRLLQQTLRIC